MKGGIGRSALVLAALTLVAVLALALSLNAGAHGPAQITATPCPDAIACHVLKRVTRVP